MIQKKNKNSTIYILFALVLICLFAFKKPLLAVYNKLKNKMVTPPTSGGAAPAAAVAAVADVIKLKQVLTPSVIKASPRNKREIRNNSVPFKLGMPKNDAFPFAPIKEGIWNPKPYFNTNIQPFNTNLFSI